MSAIAGKNVLITGGASGMGRLVARRVAALGGNLVLWDVNPDNLERVRAEAERASGRPALAHVCDVSDRAQVYETANRVKASIGPLDILVNSAGVVTGAPFLELPDEKVELTFGVNALALFWTAKAFLPDMIARNSGHLVTIASASGYVGVANLADYSASKWAAIGFDESLRAELRKTAPGVRTTVVCPYYVDTGMFKGVRSRFPRLLPILKEERVADRIVSAIQRNKRRVVMPPLVHLVPLLRPLPVALFDAVNDFLGVNVSMERFVGRRNGPADSG
jgi:all-trans-retinol dehydrogenase (NAD+)